RRKFLHYVSIGLGTAAIAGSSPMVIAEPGVARRNAEITTAGPQGEIPSATIDFRYSPLSFQTAYCFPDDHLKSLIGENGELRYGHPGLGGGIAYFPEVVEF